MRIQITRGQWAVFGGFTLVCLANLRLGRHRIALFHSDSSSLLLSLFIKFSAMYSMLVYFNRLLQVTFVSMQNSNVFKEARLFDICISGLFLFQPSATRMKGTKVGHTGKRFDNMYAAPDTRK